MGSYRSRCTPIIPISFGFGPHQELGYCFGDIGNDPENKVIIFTGSGDTFIHKEDLGGTGPDAKIWGEHVLPDAKRLLMNLLEIQAPMIATINGPATVHAELGVLCDVSGRAELSQRACTWRRRARRAANANGIESRSVFLNDRARVVR